MYTQASPDIIRHLRALIDDHSLCIAQCLAQPRRDGDKTGDHHLVKKYVHDHKLLKGELVMLLQGLGQGPVVPGAGPPYGTGDRPRRRVQPLSADMGLSRMMAELDREMENGYLSVLRAGPVPDAIKDKAVLHVAFLRGLQVTSGGTEVRSDSRIWNAPIPLPRVGEKSSLVLGRTPFFQKWGCRVP